MRWRTFDNNGYNTNTNNHYLKIMMIIIIIKTTTIIKILVYESEMVEDL